MVCCSWLLSHPNIPSISVVPELVDGVVKYGHCGVRLVLAEGRLYVLMVRACCGWKIKRLLC